MVKEVIRTENFLRKLKKLDKSYLDRIEKLIVKIIEYPEIGKPVKFDKKGTREVYVSPFRISYAYDKQNDILFFLEIYHKDEQ
ncbi:type II toxin-antitoxin system RelE/ParE family toxin [Candidatus Pacearchaeota archaeon]|nr:type II toxin-antitoxin system RelE/ParE family toxin [Candidatus Pacearchaeota archaeon]